MAASNLNLGKASGGVLNIQPADGTTTTSLVLPAINGTVVAADSNGNVGIGTIPYAWGSNYKALQIGGMGIANRESGNETFISNNSYHNGTNDIYKSTSYSNKYTQQYGQHQWFTAPSGTAGNAITWTNAMTLDANGNLGIGTSTPKAKLDVQGDMYANNLVGFKNYIINGNFDIWQYKNAGLTYPQTSDGYGSDDRWYNTNNISTKVHSQVSCTDSERALFNASYFSRTVATYVSGTNSLVKKLQSIENITKLAGKTVTVSFWAKADSSKKMNVQVVDFYGTGGTPTANGTSIVNFGNVDLTSTWTKYKLTATLPSLVGKTLGTDGVHTSRFRLDFGFTFGPDRNEVTSFGMPIGQSGTFDIAQVQLEEGSVATPFEQRPYGLELSLCQRYFRPNPILGGYGQYANTTHAVADNPYAFEMRVPPTTTLGSNPIWHDPNLAFRTITGIVGTGYNIEVQLSTDTGYRYGQITPGSLLFSAEF